MEDNLALRAQVTQIRATVQRDGEALVGCEELRILCPDYLTVSEQFARIVAIAQVEHWSFAFLPDGNVCFARLDGQHEQEGSSSS